MNRQAERWPRLVAAAAALGLLALAGACALLALGQGWIARGPWPMGYVVYACVHVSGSRLQLGWLPPMVMSSIPRPWPLSSCLFLPWLPFLPASGAVAFPP